MRLAITGTPGTGKSRIAELLGKKLGWHVLHLSSFVKEKNLYSGWDRTRKCWIVDEEKLKAEIAKIKEKNLIIEGHFAHILPSDIVIVLRLAQKKLTKRLQRRGWSKAKITENIEAEIMGICLIEAKELNKKVFEIDTTDKPVSQIINNIIKIITC
jgi:adenylate kinase